jgi:addiction module HigA family antidote
MFPVAHPLLTGGGRHSHRQSRALTCGHKTEVTEWPCNDMLRVYITDMGAPTREVTRPLATYRGISPDMALRLDRAFGGGAETWLRLQAAYDLAQARRVRAASPMPPAGREPAEGMNNERGPTGRRPEAHGHSFGHSGPSGRFWHLAPWSVSW